jgi:hypothetical protein
MLDDSRLRQHRTQLIPLLRDSLAVSEFWQYREQAIETLLAWGEDTRGLDVRQEAFAVCDPQDVTAPSPASAEAGWGNADGLPF